MSEAKYTPGPWEACSNLVRTKITAEDRRGFLVAECPPNTGHALDDAHLIAAALELLEALSFIRSEIQRKGGAVIESPSIKEWLARTDAAIAKAEGKAEREASSCDHRRDRAIQDIEALFPADCEYADTAEIGQELLDTARRNNAPADWREESDAVLLAYAALCVDRENSIAHRILNDE